MVRYFSWVALKKIASRLLFIIAICEIAMGLPHINESVIKSDVVHALSHLRGIEWFWFTAPLDYLQRAELFLYLSYVLAGRRLPARFELISLCLYTAYSVYWLYIPYDTVFSIDVPFIALAIPSVPFACVGLILAARDFLRGTDPIARAIRNALGMERQRSVIETSISFVTDSWLRKHRYDWLARLSQSNRLVVLEVLEQINEALELTDGFATIRLMPLQVKHDGLPRRGDEYVAAYLESRWGAVNLLVRRGVLISATMTAASPDLHSDTQVRIVGEDAPIAASLRVLRRSTSSTSNRAGASRWRDATRRGLPALLAAAGIAVFLSDVPWRWSFIAGSATAFAMSLRRAPQLRRLPPVVVDVATVIGAAAAVGAVVVALLHL